MTRKSETPSKPRTEPAGRPRLDSDAERELTKRIERLEERLDESILGEDGLGELDAGIDKSPSGDALKRAVTRSNVKRGSRKA